MKSLCLWLLVIAGCMTAAAQNTQPPPPRVEGPYGRSPFDAYNQRPQERRPLNAKQLESGAFKLLMQRSGLAADELGKLYVASAAENFHAFGTAVLAAGELKLDTLEVLNGLYTQSLVDTLRSLGVTKDDAKKAQARASSQMKEAGESRKTETQMAARHGQ